MIKLRDVIFTLLLTFIFDRHSLAVDCSDTLRSLLFSGPGVPIENYEASVAALSAGGLISFSNGKVFRLQRFVNEGTKNRIFSIESENVIRFLKSYAVTKNHYPEAYLLGYQKLRYYDVPTVLLFPELSFPPEYVIGQLLHPEMDFETFTKLFFSIPEDKRQIMLSAYEVFVRKTAKLREIGDLDGTQLIYEEGEWKLGDFDYTVIPASQPYASSVLDFLPKLPGEFQKRMVGILMNEREHLIQWMKRHSEFELAWVKPTEMPKVKTIPQETLVPLKVQVAHGRLVDARGEWIDTHGQNRIYLMNDEGEIFLSNSKINLLNPGMPVSGVGEMRVSHGHIDFINRTQDPYETSGVHLRQVLNRLEGMRADLTGTKVVF